MGAETLADELKGFDANFYIYTTTDQPGTRTTFSAQGASFGNPVMNSEKDFQCEWEEPDSNGQLQKKTGATCPTTLPTKTISESRMKMNPSLGLSSIGEPIHFNKSDSPDALNEKAKALAQSILNTGTNGSSTETGLCTLVRSVYNDRANSIFNEGDNAAMVVLSDEDDSSTLSSCISRETTEKNYIGNPPVLQNCNPALGEKCDIANYKITYQQQKLPYSKVTAKYACNEEQIDSRSAGSLGFSKVQYDFKPLKAKISYTCEDYKDYKINFKPLNREMRYKTYTKVPYTISFENKTSYSKTLKYQCQVRSDGVVIESSPEIQKINYLTNTSACESGASVSCNDSEKSAATTLCGSGAELVPNSCFLTCRTESQAVNNLRYNDTDIAAYSRDLTDETKGYQFVSNNKTYSSLDTWAKAQTGYANAVIKSKSRGLADISTSFIIKDLAYSDSCQSDFSWSLCSNDSAIANEPNLYPSGTAKLVPESCEYHCKQSASETHLNYYDYETETDRDLRSTSFSINGTTYVNLTEYAEKNYYPKTVQSIDDPKTTQTTSSLADLAENCDQRNDLGIACETDSLAQSTATSKCGNAKKKSASCVQKCVTGPIKTITLDNPESQDSSDFCTNTDTEKTFTVNGSSYVSISDYLQKTDAFSSANKVPKLSDESGSCARKAFSFQEKSYETTKEVFELTTCPLPSENFDWKSYFPPSVDANFLCNKTSPRQNGYETSPSFLCSNTNENGSPLLRDDPSKPSLTISDNQHKVILGSDQLPINLCENPFATESGVNYSNLFEWAEGTQANASSRSNEKSLSDASLRPSCSVEHKKYVDPGTVSLDTSKPAITKKWSFPLDVESTNSQKDLKAAFIEKSNSLFGKNGYFVSAIIRDANLDNSVREASPDNPEICPNLDADQKYGGKYLELVNQLVSSSNGPKGEVASICAPNYSTSLRAVSQWIKETAQRTVYAPEVLRSDMKILAVFIFDPIVKSEVRLRPVIDFETIGSKIHIINNNINLEGKTIRYIYWDPQSPPKSGN